MKLKHVALPLALAGGFAAPASSFSAPGGVPATVSLPGPFSQSTAFGCLPDGKRDYVCSLPEEAFQPAAPQPAPPPELRGRPRSRFSTLPPTAPSVMNDIPVQLPGENGPAQFLCSRIKTGAPFSPYRCRFVGETMQRAPAPTAPAPPAQRTTGAYVGSGVAGLALAALAVLGVARHRGGR